MNIGELDSRIEIYRLNTQLNSYGEEEPAPVLLKTVWAKVEPRTGSLLSGRPAETMLSKTTHAITVRAEALKGITPDCYILWDGSDRSAAPVLTSTIFFRRTRRQAFSKI